MRELVNTDWYDALIDECQAIITETLYLSRQALIEGKHKVGERIVTDPNFKKIRGSKTAVLQQIFRDLGIGKSEGYACVQFYEQYPNLSASAENFPEQKNLSWEKIKRHYLPTTVQKISHQDCKHEDTYLIRICRDCGERKAEE